MKTQRWMFSAWVLPVLTCTIMLSWVKIASPGNGKFIEAPGRPGRFNFVVSLQFDATSAQIDLVKQRFAAASIILSNATKGQHQFGNIVICNNSRASDYAEFLINKHSANNCATSPGCGDTNAKLCGFGIQNGEETPCEFNPNGASTFSNIHWNRICDEARGPITLVHEFSHLAYGLGDEYSDGASTPNSRCVDPSSITGTQDACLMENYYQDGGENTLGTEPATETIGCWVHGPVLITPTLKKFCDASNHTNGRPPDTNRINHQHTLSSGNSCWQTILSKYEIFPISDPPPVFDPPAPDPTIISVGVPERRIVLIIDRSGSMSGGKLSALQTAAENFVRNLPTDDFKLGVVSYDLTARIDFNLTDVNETSIAAAVDTIGKLNADGLTAIGEGLQTALNMLPEQRASLETFILLSDGKHNSDGANPIAEVIPRLVARGAVVFTVGIGAGVAEDRLTEIAKRTGGKFFDAPGRLPEVPLLQSQPVRRFMAQSRENPFRFELQNIFVELLRRVQEGAFFVNQASRIEAQASFSIPVKIDSMTERTSFVVNWRNEGVEFDLTIVRPDGSRRGRRIPVPDSTATFTSTITSEGVNVVNPPKGDWTMLITNRSTGLSSDFRAHAISDLPNVGVWAAPTAPIVIAPEPISIGAQPFSKGLAIANAKVAAIVTKPGLTEQDTVALLDNGQSGDAKAGDGVYFGKFSNYNRNDEYIIDVVTKVEDGVFITGNHLDGVTTEISVEDFTRTTQFAVTVNGVLPSSGKDILYAIDENRNARQEMVRIDFSKTPFKIDKLGHIISEGIELKGIAGMSWDPTSAPKGIFVALNRKRPTFNALYHIALDDIPEPDGSRRIQAKKIGEFTGHFVNAIAVNSVVGTMFGVTKGESGKSSLVRIDKNSADLHQIGDIGFDDIEGLTFTVEDNPTLYGYSNDANRLVAIDTTTGRGVAIGDRVSFEDVACLAFTHHGRLIGFSFDRDGDDSGRRSFVELAPGSLTGRVIRAPGFSPKLRGATFLWPREFLTPKEREIETPRPLVPPQQMLREIQMTEEVTKRNSYRAQIIFELNEPQHVVVRIYNELEQEVKLLVDEVRASRRHVVGWDGTATDGTPVPPGKYFYNIVSGQQTLAGQMRIK